MSDGDANGARPLAFAANIPFAQLLGMELWAFADGQAELRLQLAPQHLNSGGMAHGGVLMALLDVAMAHAARSPSGAAGAVGPGVVTIEMKTSFMRGAQGRLSARGRLLHKTVTMAFTEGSVFNADGQLCTHATGTFKYLQAQPAARRPAHALPSAAPHTTESPQP